MDCQCVIKGLFNKFVKTKYPDIPYRPELVSCTDLPTYKMGSSPYFTVGGGQRCDYVDSTNEVDITASETSDYVPYMEIGWFRDIEVKRGSEILHQVVSDNKRLFA